MGKENQRVVVTKRMLKEALLSLLENKNIEKVNVTELCRKAGINRATFYAHYQTPHDVLMEIELDIARELHIQTPLKNSAEVEGYLVRIFTYVSDHADVLKLLIRNNSFSDLAELMDAYLKMLLDTYSIDMDADSIRLLYAYMSGGGLYLVRMWLMEDVKKTPEEVARLIMRFYSLNLETDRL